MSSRQLVVLLALTGTLIGAAACKPPAPGAGGLEPTAGEDYDPVSMDPGQVNGAYPPTMVELTLQSDGATLNGLMYLAQGAGPHPTVVLLHGFPGHERNLDLAQAVRRAGSNVLFFNYRGSWGSGGTFSLSGAIDDVAAAIAFLRSETALRDYRSDPDRIALIGHSMGGFMALMGASRDASIECVASIAGANLGVLGKAARASQEVAAAMTAALGASMNPESGPIRAEVASAGEELVEHADEFDTTGKAGALSGRALLLVAGTRDMLATKSDHHDPLIRALEETGARSVREVVFEDDHYFSTSRLALAGAVVAWLKQACGY